MEVKAKAVLNRVFFVYITLKFIYKRIILKNNPPKRKKIFTSLINIFLNLKKYFLTLGDYCGGSF